MHLDGEEPEDYEHQDQDIEDHLKSDGAEREIRLECSSNSIFDLHRYCGRLGFFSVATHLEPRYGGQHRVQQHL